MGQTRGADVSAPPSRLLLGGLCGTRRSPVMRRNPYSIPFMAWDPDPLLPVLSLRHFAPPKLFRTEAGSDRPHFRLTLCPARIKLSVFQHRSPRFGGGFKTKSPAKSTGGALTLKSIIIIMDQDVGCAVNPHLRKTTGATTPVVFFFYCQPIVPRPEHKVYPRSSTISSALQTWSATPAAIAGVVSEPRLL